MSVAAITRTYGKPHLYTDDLGRKILCDELQLDFADIDTSLNNLPKEFSRFYSLGRSYACSSQTSQFLHVDFDAFLYEKLPADFHEFDVIFEKRFCADKKEPSLCRPMLFSNAQQIPDWWNQYNEQKTFEYSSLGVFGGKQFDFFKKFHDGILNILDNNRNYLENSKIRFASELYHHKLFLAQYTLDQYLSHHLAAKMNLSIRHVVSPNNISQVRYAHVFTDKSVQTDLYGRIARRIMSDYPSVVPQLEKVCGESYKIPSVDFIIVPNNLSSVYDNVVRTLIPRNVRPNNVLVSQYNLLQQDKELIAKLEHARLVPQGIDYMSSLQLALSRCTSDLVVIMDGHVRLYKFFVEKIIAAYFDKKNCVYCCAAKDYKKDSATYYGAKFVHNKIMPNIDEQTKISDNIKVDALFGGLYIFPRALLQDILINSNLRNFIDISTVLRDRNIPIYCIKSLEVSHCNKIGL